MTPHALRRAVDGSGEYRLLAVITVSVVATMLVIIGSFLWVTTQLSGMLDHWGKDVQISCYLADDVSYDRVFELKEQLQTRPEVAAVTFVSKDEAAERFASSMDGLDRILSDLDSNPLPSSLELRLHPEFQDPEQVARIAESLRAPEFQDMDWSQEWVERFHQFVTLLRLSALLLGLLLSLGAAFVVGNTLRLSIWSRRDELALIALVGGTRSFARRPFLVEGLLQGLMGSVLAVALLLILERLALSRLASALGALWTPELVGAMPLTHAALLLAAGPVLGLLGAWSAVLQAGDEL